MSSQSVPDPVKNALYALLALAAGWAMAYALDKLQGAQEAAQAPVSVPEWMVTEARGKGWL